MGHMNPNSLARGAAHSNALAEKQDLSIFHNRSLIAALSALKHLYYQFAHIDSPFQPSCNRWSEPRLHRPA